MDRHLDATRGTDRPDRPAAPRVLPGLFEQVWLNGRLTQHLHEVYAGPSEPAVAVGLTDARGAATYTKVALARAAGRVSRASGRGGGTTAPGRVLLRRAPRAIRTLAARLDGGVVAISATNGKTSAARMLAAILEAQGRSVVHNRLGANTHWGVAAALAERDGEVGVFEVDEAWLPLLAAELKPSVVVLGNLARDRLDSYGELDLLVRVWRDLIRRCRPPTVVVANADDPLLAGPGGVLEQATVEPVLFGIADRTVGRAAPEHPHDGHSCTLCGGPVRYTSAFVGHLGHYRCGGCRRARPEPTVRALDVRERGLDGVSLTIALATTVVAVDLSLPGLHNVYNALAASAAGLAFGAEPGMIRDGLQAVRAPFGRAESIELGGRDVRLLLVKNPVGMNVTLRLLGEDKRHHPLHLWLALNDELLDGRDVSWIWDADFEALAGAVGAATCSGRRASELALRLKYAGWRCRLDVRPDLETGFESALARAPRSLIAMPTYTALLGLRPVLNRRGVALTDWGTDARAAS